MARIEWNRDTRVPHGRDLKDPSTSLARLEVIKGRNLKKECTKTLVRVKTSFQEFLGNEVESVHDPTWNYCFDFPATKCVETVHLQVLSAGLRSPLGEASLEVSSRVGTWEGWVPVETPSNGHVFVRWQYPLGGDSDAKPKAEGRERAKSIGDADVSHMGTVGQLTIEVVKARNLALAEFCDTISASVTVAFGAGPDQSTAMRKRTVDPYWNQTFKFAVNNASDKCTISVFDSVDKERRFVGAAPFTHFRESAKGTQWLSLKSAASDDVTGEVHIRFGFKRAPPPKTQKHKDLDDDDDDDDIVLDYVPQITPETGFVPDRRLYIWFNLFEDPSFKSNLQTKLLDHYFQPLPKKGAPVPGRRMDELVGTVWRCNGRNRLFTNIRIAAEQYHLHKSVTMPPDEEQALRLWWKEHSIMMQEILGLQAVEHAFRKLWNSFSHGDQNAGLTGIDTNASTSQTVLFEKEEYLLLAEHIYSIPACGISKDVAHKVAQADWERADAQHAVSGSCYPLFLHLLKEVTSFWVETLTETEVLAFLGSLTPVIMKVRNQLLKGQQTSSAALGPKKASAKKASRQTIMHLQPDPCSKKSSKSRPGSVQANWKELGAGSDGDVDNSSSEDDSSTRIMPAISAQARKKASTADGNFVNDPFWTVVRTKAPTEKTEKKNERSKSTIPALPSNRWRSGYQAK
uniref:C2 domain-containing protein n=1 Tax=Eutreptiella gymnastica TaxID=73025 RepID=A0A7S4LET0_9EUGL